MHFKCIQRWYFIAIVLLFISVTSARDECYSDATYNYYCDSPLTCCYANTKCCSGSSSFDFSSSYSSSSSFSSVSVPIGLIIGGVVGGLILLFIVGIIVRGCVNKHTHSGRVIQPEVQTTAQAYSQHTVNYTPTSGQYQINAAPIAGQNRPYGNMPAYFQPNGQILQSNPEPPSYSEKVNQNQNSGDQVSVVIPKAPGGL